MAYKSNKNKGWKIAGIVAVVIAAIGGILHYIGKHHAQNQTH
jgi:disulfide bond formation protein DsbB